MTVVALTTLVCGGREVAVGEEVPTSITFAGRTRPVDHDDLVARGLAERKAKGSGSRKASSKGSAGAE